MARDTLFATNEEYFEAELSRVDSLLKAWLLRQKSAVLTAKAAKDEGVSWPAACDVLLAGKFAWGDPIANSACAPEAQRKLEGASSKDREITEQLRRLEAEGKLPALHQRLLGLGLLKYTQKRRETLLLDLLLLALFADRIPKYRSAFAQVPTAGALVPGYLTVEMALEIAQQDPGPQKLQWNAFSPQSPLVTQGLLDTREWAALPLIRRPVRIDDRIADLLMGLPTCDPVIAAAVRFTSLRKSWDELTLDQSTLLCLQELSAAWQKRREVAWPREIVLLLHGPAGSPCLPAVQAFVRRESPSEKDDGKLLEVDVAKALTVAANWEDFVVRCYREACLQARAICWQGWDHLAAHPERAQVVMSRAEIAPISTFLTGESAWDPAGGFQKPTCAFGRVHLSVPSEPVRRIAWKQALHPEESASDVETAAERALLDALASFQFTAGQIGDALAMARGVALAAHPANPIPGLNDLYEGCRRQAARRLVSFAQRIQPRPGFDHLSRIIVPPDITQQLAELAARMRNVNVVHHRLGFEHRLSLGRGLVALFSGPSGTGKTMAATLLAGQNRKDLYKVDVASVTSKFVGETERNLSRIFSDAEDSNAVLFFDEADALFGKRGEVEHAQDRWANLEVNFLLQRIEEYTGTVILATNFRQNIDEAFLRRIQVLVSFPVPSAADRLRILQGMLPPMLGDATGIPPPTELELKEIADRFELSGGSLKNVVLDAAFRAVDSAEGDKSCVAITREHLLLGVAREFQKLNKPITIAEFGRDGFEFVQRSLKIDHRS